MLAADVIQTARRLLRDDIGPHRWEAAELLEYLAAAQAELLRARPALRLAAAGGPPQAMPSALAATDTLLAGPEWRGALAQTVACRALEAGEEPESGGQVERWERAWKEALRG